MGIISVLIYRLFQSEKKRKIAENSFRELESKVNKLELQTLESKLSPHLFKNVLNSIQSYAYQTYYAMDKLAYVLDYVLYESKRKFVTPKEEIEFALNLIEINKIKLSPLFQLDVKVKVRETEPLYEQRLLAPLISIDLIENAFKHADLQNPDAFITVTFVFKDNIFSLTVANKISSKESIIKEKGGIGIETLKQRLRIIYQDNFSMEQFVENDIYISHLKINLFEHKAKMRIARR
ncbi:MAG: histidine kinase [Chitinophagales bacterium]|nr:histidine kinase [Chitinophagales bacterium]